MSGLIKLKDRGDETEQSDGCVEVFTRDELP